MFPHSSVTRLAKLLLALGMLALGTFSPSFAAPGSAPERRERRVLSDVHADAVSTFIDDGELVLGTKADVDGSLGVRLDTDLTIFNVEEASRTVIPDIPAYSFLGAVGSDVWLAPEVQASGIIWPGFNTESVPAGALDGDEVILRLESVSGPGTLHVFQSDVFGEPIRRFSSTGTDYREWSLPPGTHVHANWAFSAAGKYTLTFSANASIGGSPVSTTQNYNFVVGDVPAPVATITALVANPTLLETGDSVTLAATVTPAGAVGYVEFLDGTAVLGHEAVIGGSASLVTTGLAIGTHPVTARFVPEWLNDFSISTSAVASVTVTGSQPVTMPEISLVLQGNELDMTLKVPSGDTYELQFSATLEEGSWEPVGEPITGSGQPVTRVLPKSGDKGFYRLRLVEDS